MEKIKYQTVLLVFTLSAGELYAVNNEDNTSPLVRAEVNGELSAVVVTGQNARSTQVELNPKAAVQPITPSDGAGLLKTVANMSVVRKGGSSGDPLFRGLGGSRLSITANNQFIFGGCGGRMDPPTAYIFPDSYDKVVITKGPQTVTQGPGVITGSVQFIRKEPYFDQAKITGYGSLVTANFNRLDSYAEALAGTTWGYARVNAMYNKSDDYKDGEGNKVHSHYKRHNEMLQLGLTPWDNSLFEINYDRSRGEAAYADRGMDGSVFDRDSYGFKFKQQNISPVIQEILVRYGHSYVDHVMDNYSLRNNTSGKYRAANPDRTTDTAQISIELDWHHVNLLSGIDWLNDKHQGRNGLGSSAAAASAAYKAATRNKDQKASNLGLFSQLSWHIDDNHQIIAGLRYDTAKVSHYKQAIEIKKRHFNLSSGFIRYEYNQQAWSYFAGLGIAQRIPDFWERNRNNELRAEMNKELDLGIRFKQKQFDTSLSIFASDIDHFILVDNNAIPKGRNINAQRYGFEGDFKWNITDNWSIASVVAYTHGKNKTDNSPLAQTPPLEFKNSISFENDYFSTSFLMRHVAKQNRFVSGQGNIAGQDTGPSTGFSVFSLNGVWKINKNINLALGIDNLWNKQYAEFVNKSSADVVNYSNPSGVKIYEPGRQFWLKLQGKF